MPRAVAAAIVILLLPACGGGDATPDRSVSDRSDSTTGKKSDTASESEPEGKASLEEYYGANIMKRARRLDSLHKELQGNGSKAECKAFFESLPNSFSEFRQIYGYPPDSAIAPSGPLAARIEHVMTISRRLGCVGDQKLASWKINIATGGEWQADGIGIFAGEIQGAVQEKTELYCQLLNNRTEKESVAFWYFLFAGPDPAEGIPRGLRDSLKRNCSGQAELAEKGLKQAAAKWSHH